MNIQICFFVCLAVAVIGVIIAGVDCHLPQTLMSMYGLTDDIQALNAENKKLKEQLHDLKVLTQLLVDNPQNTIAREAARIAVKNIESV
jgi:cell division protein FtsB